MIHPEEMPWENSPDGKIKHLIHRNMKTPELCVEAYMLFLEANGRSGKRISCGDDLPSLLASSRATSVITTSVPA